MMWQNHFYTSCNKVKKEAVGSTSPAAFTSIWQDSSYMSTHYIALGINVRATATEEDIFRSSCISISSMLLPILKALLLTLNYHFMIGPI